MHRNCCRDARRIDKRVLDVGTRRWRTYQADTNFAGLLIFINEQVASLVQANRFINLVMSIPGGDSDWFLSCCGR